MTTCKHCGSDKLESKGKRTRADGTVVRRYLCNSCGKNMTVDIDAVQIDKASEINKRFLDDVTDLVGFEKYVITSVQNDTDLNLPFLKSLEGYCEANGAKLIVIPIRYQNPTIISKPVAATWDSRVQKYMMDQVLDLGPVKILGDLKIQATMQSPLNGLEPLTCGKTTIVGHAQIQLRSCPRLQDDHPIILTTTGTISETNYSDSRVGYIAEFNHSLGAVVLEIPYTGDEFHIRHVSGQEENGEFVDLGVRYKPDGSSEFEGALAIVTGDEHALLVSGEVVKATYTNEDSIVNKLKPEFIVRHDVLDSYSISHHHDKDLFRQIHKARYNITLEGELEATLRFIDKTTPSYPEFKANVFVPSNHNSHLMKWLQNEKSAADPINAHIYTYLRYRVLNSMTTEGWGDPFVLWLSAKLPENKNVFLKRGESKMIGDIEVGLHGDAGINGSRGSAKSISRLSAKTIIGHSHSPCIEKGTYQVGTSTPFDLEYTNGLTSWMNTHCVIYKNSKRQMINIINGRWRYE